MANTSTIAIVIGLIMISLTAINSLTIDQISPSIQRAEIISALTSVSILLIGFLVKKDEAFTSQQKDKLEGKQGFYLFNSLASNIKHELAWGTQMILSNTAASTILIYYNDRVISRRGLINDTDFKPGIICNSSISKSNYISLVSTKFYPGKQEFDPIVKNLPSVIVFPIGNRGWLIVGGWSERCFTKSDELWIDGWAKKLLSLI